MPYTVKFISFKNNFRGYNHKKRESLNYLENYAGILELTDLFKGIKTIELHSMLKCLGAGIRSAKKGEIILLEGDRLEFIGIVLAGQIHIIREDYNGNRSLMAAITPGGIFAEVLYFAAKAGGAARANGAGISQSPVTVIAAEDSSILKMSFTRVLKTCSSSCAFHNKMIENMLGLIAKKNMMLQSRMEILELKTIREKVTRYLESFGERKITLPFNREEMADFLCVERSALSHELTKMKNDGLIEYRKNCFTVL